ncbi:MAG TPA: hypothetical protein VFD91_17820 [Mariniphaga sp.]|nr:hypothetical protein [Mariniphaga sp.]
MNTKLEMIYLKLPLFFQNIVIMLYGFHENRVRYSGIYNKFSKEIERNCLLSEEELKKWQENRLRNLLNDAIKNVPYYRKNIKLNASKINRFRIGDLKYLPILEKNTVKRYAEQLVSESFTEKKIEIHTTGTTGTPLKIICTPEIRQKNYAYFNRFLKIAGIDYNGIRATFGGRIIVDYNHKSPPFWRYSHFQKNMLFSSYHISEKTIESYTKALQRLRPSYIDAYPSSLYMLAKYAEQKSISLQKLTKSIVTSAEVLHPCQREVIEKRFGVPIYDQYGSAEMCVFIAQCGLGKYHIHSDYSIVEFIKDDGTYAGPGEEAEIVCTGLINPVMPLIRYKIGDRGIISEEKCKCGNKFPVLERIIGRSDDYIITPDGRKIGRLSPVLKGYPVREAQYVQEKPDEIIVNVVKDAGYNENTGCKIEDELRKRLGDRIKIYINCVNKIERGKGGKYKTVISKIP